MSPSAIRETARRGEDWFMPEPLLHSASPTEYFRDLVESALHHQHVAVRDLTSFYVVNLLAGYVHRDRARLSDDEALGLRFVRALQSGGSAQRDGLRHVGDTSLFLSGFFSDSFNRRLVDIDYYIALGERAYGSLAHRDEALGDVFDELADKFAAMVDVLTEVSEQTALGRNADVMRLYEKWLRTGSGRSGGRGGRGIGRSRRPGKRRRLGRSREDGRKPGIRDPRFEI